MPRYNWIEIQKFYDEGHTWREVIEEFGVSMAAITSARKRGDFVSRERSSAMKLSCKLKPRKLSEKTKEKISKARRKFLKENPDKVPYLLNHHSKGMSYPEKYFEKLFRNENIELIYHHRVGTYQLDFSDPIRKIDIEIDGEQHYCDEKIIKSDKRRNKYLEDNGWFVYRIRWSKYNKLDKKHRKMVVAQIKNVIKDKCANCKIETTIEEYVKKLEEEKTNRCVDCNKAIEHRSTRCTSCNGKLPSRRKVQNRPSKEELKDMIDKMTWVAIGKKYGVTCNTIRKWARSYGII